MIWRALRAEFGDVRALSLRDRDDEAPNSVGALLEDKADAHGEADFLSRKWRRRYLESYLILPATIARAAGRAEADVKSVLNSDFSLVIKRGTYVKSSVPGPLLDLRGKAVLQHFGLSAVAVAKRIEPDEVCADLELMTREVCAFG